MLAGNLSAPKTGGGGGLSCIIVSYYSIQLRRCKKLKIKCNLMRSKIEVQTFHAQFAHNQWRIRIFKFWGPV